MTVHTNLCPLTLFSLKRWVSAHAPCDESYHIDHISILFLRDREIQGPYLWFHWISHADGLWSHLIAQWIFSIYFQLHRGYLDGMRMEKTESEKKSNTLTLIYIPWKCSRVPGLPSNIITFSSKIIYGQIKLWVTLKLKQFLNSIL